MPRKPCLVCGTPVLKGSRCKAHGGMPFDGAKQRYTKMPNDMRNRVLARDGHRCTQCGSTIRLEVDHIRAVSQGGRHEATNLRTLCHSCHATKTARDGHEAWKRQRA